MKGYAGPVFVYADSVRLETLRNFSDLNVLLWGLRGYFAKRAGGLPSFQLQFEQRQVLEAAALAINTKTLTYFCEGIIGSIDDETRQLLALVLDFHYGKLGKINTKLIEETSNVIRILEDDGIDSLVMKGPVQHSLLYGTISNRPASDIDLLVGKRNYEQALRTLAKAGLVSVTPGSIWWDIFLGERHLVKSTDTTVLVDLHHRVQQPGSPTPFHVMQFLENSIRHDVGGKLIPTLCADDISLLSAMSLVKGLFTRDTAATHACDLFAAISSQEANSFQSSLERVDAQGLRGTLLLALRILSAAFAVRIPILQQQIDLILPEFSDEDWIRMVFAPTTLDKWPKRRHLLWTACMGHPSRFAGEYSWYTISEVSRRLTIKG